MVYHIFSNVPHFNLGKSSYSARFFIFFPLKTDPFSVTEECPFKDVNNILCSLAFFIKYLNLTKLECILKR